MTPRSRRLLLGTALTVLALAGAAAVLTAGASAAAPQKLTLYSYTKQEAFLNAEDDRVRGVGNNPFGLYSQTQGANKEVGKGPFPGDTAFFQTALYTDAKLKNRVGTGTFNCGYTFNRNAVCSVSLVLKGGTLMGAGEFSFDALNFTIAIKGGTDRYRALSGAMAVAAKAGQDRVQRFQLTLHPA
jgi:hypothetical protein